VTALHLFTARYKTIWETTFSEKEDQNTLKKKYYIT